MDRVKKYFKRDFIQLALVPLKYVIYLDSSM